MYKNGTPHMVAVKEGDTHYICQCGLTSTPPYCDGSHSATDKSPLEYKVMKDETLFICGCGKSGRIPFCDGSHNK